MSTRTFRIIRTDAHSEQKGKECIKGEKEKDGSDDAMEGGIERE